MISEEPERPPTRLKDIRGRYYFARAGFVLDKCLGNPAKKLFDDNRPIVIVGAITFIIILSLGLLS